ncbi:IS66 family insertion sequence element accessory protein TnpB [uncultured Pseudomonas sp.]|uniref:IS66 family insertion sequence element accessory protein TnpB n=1 Tax=uncultured Pseudomonas sp. TaxID=114707 RepID=UPI0025E54D9E|nr:IS66 family insertion sequence element accessory protein TnpB [uncultured Pseudomonas sp.]
MMRPDAKVEKVYLYPKPVDFRKSIDGLAALVELDIKVAVFDPVLFVFLNKPRNRVKILYWGVSRTLASVSDAVSKMGVGLPVPACRSWLQTTRCCCVQKAWW